MTNAELTDMIIERALPRAVTESYARSVVAQIRETEDAIGVGDDDETITQIDAILNEQI